jgi:hypothetical protein
MEDDREIVGEPEREIVDPAIYAPAARRSEVKLASSVDPEC